MLQVFRIPVMDWQSMQGVSHPTVQDAGIGSSIPITHKLTDGSIKMYFGGRFLCKNCCGFVNTCYVYSDMM